MCRIDQAVGKGHSIFAGASKPQYSWLLVFLNFDNMSFRISKELRALTGAINARRAADKPGEAGQRQQQRQPEL